MQRYFSLTDAQQDAITVICPVASSLDDFEFTPLPCYHSELLAFAEVLSEQLGQLSEAPNARAFGFFLRQRSLNHAIEARQTAGARAPLGMSFHLVPSNVPMVAFYSALASLLQGNPTIVRLSSRELPEQQLVLTVLNELLSQPRWQPIAARIRFIRYPHDNAITTALSAQAASRVIWGGDASVSAIRALTLPACAHEIAFGDRQSLAIFDEASLRQLSDRTLELQLTQLVADISLFDQQSCSSPALLVWIGHDSHFRDRVFRILGKLYPDAGKRISAQLHHLQSAAIEGMIDQYQQAEGLGWGELVLGAKVPERAGGTLYWQQVEQLSEWLAIGGNYQTCVCVGGSREQLREALLEHPQMRIDRIVAPGQALAFDWHWDGWDLLSALSRKQS